MEALNEVLKDWGFEVFVAQFTRATVFRQENKRKQAELKGRHLGRIVFLAAGKDKMTSE